MYRPATLFQPSFLSKMVNSSELPFPSGQLQVAIDASLSEMANVLGEGPPKRRRRVGNREAELLGGPSRPAG